MAIPARLIPVLRLMRLELAAPVIGSSWLMVWIGLHLEPVSRRNPQLNEWGLWASMLLGAAVACGMSIYALAINDLWDVRHDRAFEPQRPLPSGKVNPRMALVLALVSLTIAMVAAVLLGTYSALLALLAAMVILFYNTAGKYLPAAGVVALGLVIALNMLIVCPRVGFAWPIWLNMSHVMIGATVVHILAGKRPRLRAIDLAGIFAGWLFGTLLLFAFMNLRGTTHAYELPWVWIGPGVGAAVFVILTAITLHDRLGDAAQRAKAARPMAAVALLSIMLYDAGWLAAMGELVIASMILGLLALAILGQRILTTAERWTDQTARDAGYRVSDLPTSETNERL